MQCELYCSSSYIVSEPDPLRSVTSNICHKNGIHSMSQSEVGLSPRLASIHVPNMIEGKHMRLWGVKFAVIGFDRF